MIRPALSQTPRHAVREIKVVMIPHGGMFCRLLHPVIVNFPGMMPNAIFLSFIFLSLACGQGRLGFFSSQLDIAKLIFK